MLDEVGFTKVREVGKHAWIVFKRVLPEPTRGFECTFGVDDVELIRDRILSAGGQILMDKFTIANVGHLIAFEDPGGNPALAMQYDAAAE